MKVPIKEYAQATGISMPTAYRHANQGKIESIREDKITYVILTKSQAERLFGSQEKKQLSDEIHKLSSETVWLKAQIEELTRQLADVRQASENQLTQKDEQISELHQLVALAQNNQSDTLRQLEDSRAQGRRRWWQFWS